MSTICLHIGLLWSERKPSFTVLKFRVNKKWAQHKASLFWAKFMQLTRSRVPKTKTLRLHQTPSIHGNTKNITTFFWSQSLNTLLEIANKPTFKNMRPFYDFSNFGKHAKRHYILYFISTAKWVGETVHRATFAWLLIFYVVLTVEKIINENDI